MQKRRNKKLADNEGMYVTGEGDERESARE
jgi:hypothetical protein